MDTIDRVLIILFLIFTLIFSYFLSTKYTNTLICKIVFNGEYIKDKCIIDTKVIKL